MKTMVNEKPRARKTRRTARARTAAAVTGAKTGDSPVEERQVAEMVRTFTDRWEW